LASNQILAIFNKFVRKFSQYLRSLHEKEIEKSLPKPKSEDLKLKPIEGSLEEDLQVGAREASKKMKEKQENLLKALNAPQ
jgi:hypothetical protein